MRTALRLALVTYLLSAASSSAQAPACRDDDPCAWYEKLTLGGSVQLREESWQNFAFQASADDHFALGRLTLFADLKVTPHLRVHVEGKSALSTDRDLPGGTRTLDVDTLALQSAWVEFGGGNAYDVTLRLGRQALAFGRQRLVSPLPWGNTLRAWDGARLQVRSGDRWQVDTFYTWFVPVDKYDANTRDSEEPFYGVYASFWQQPDRGLQAYWLQRKRPQVMWNGSAGAERRTTFGGRLFHESGPWRGDVELAWQGGRVGDQNVDAHMAALEVMRHFEGGTLEAAGGGLDYASGDSTPGGDVGTFSQLYPLGHAYLGAIDMIGRQNVVAAFLRGRFRVTSNARLQITASAFGRARKEDGLYNAGGTLFREANGSRERRVGEEIDFTFSRPLGSAGKLLIGYSHFSAGPFLDDTGAAASTNFYYAQYRLVL